MCCLHLLLYVTEGMELTTFAVKINYFVTVYLTSEFRLQFSGLWGHAVLQMNQDFEETCYLHFQGQSGVWDLKMSKPTTFQSKHLNPRKTYIWVIHSRCALNIHECNIWVHTISHNYYHLPTSMYLKLHVSASL
jgi:hypothetical protein